MNDNDAIKLQYSIVRLEEQLEEARSLSNNPCEIEEMTDTLTQLQSLRKFLHREY